MKILALLAAVLMLAPGLARAEEFATRAKLRSFVAGQYAAAKTPSAGPAEAIGKINAGCLKGGVALPLAGPGWQVTRVARRRYFGHPDMIGFIERLAGKAQAAGYGALTIADIGMARGGPMFNGHASHQRGLDADIWYALGVDLPKGASDPDAAPGSVFKTPDAIDPARFTQQQIDVLRWAAEDPSTERIFVSTAIKQHLCASVTGERAWLGRIRPWKGHDAHFHVRLACPAGSPHCLKEGGIPPGTGCAGDGASGTQESGNAPNLRLIRSMIRMPVACGAVLSDKP